MLDKADGIGYYRGCQVRSGSFTGVGKMRIRLIIVSTENGEREHVIFTDDRDAPATDWCESGQSVDFDSVIEAELPDAFPLDSALLRA